eukprot:300800_1
MFLVKLDVVVKKIVFYGAVDTKFESITSIEKQDKIKKPSTLTARPTRYGWIYPFKIKKIANKWCCKDDLDFVESVTVDLNIMFSHDIPTNTFIDIADLGQHISYWVE